MDATAARRRWPICLIARSARWPVLAVAVAVAQLGGCAVAAALQPWARPLDPLALGLLLAGPAALLGAGRRPAVALAVAIAAGLGYLALGSAAGPVFVSAVVALVATVAQGQRTAGWGLAAAGLAGFVAVRLTAGAGLAPIVLGAVIGWLLVVLVVAEAWRIRRERGEQAAMAVAEARLRAATEERLRIARELHDVLGHHISLINVRAGVALHLMDAGVDDGQAREAFAAIKQSSKEVLTEIRATLGVLRGVDEAAPRHPSPGLRALPDLVERLRSAGLPVHLELTGEPRAVPERVDLAAYRIVQEALTNVRRHAGPARAGVRVEFGSDELVLRVDDNGPGPPGAGPTAGNGITGMRERATAVGGTCTVGPGPGGGCRVLARLPAR
jgi:signal transduction histidine kinase